MKILVINGPNINMLGIREPQIYGTGTYEELVHYCRSLGEKYDMELEMFQSNHEGAIVDKIQEAYGRADGIVINPAAYSHYSIAIADAIKAVNIPTVEVHLTVPEKRPEKYRKNDYVAEVALKRFAGLGFEGYESALRFLKENI